MRTELNGATLLVGILCIGATPAKAVFQPTLGIAAKTEVGVVHEVNGRRHYYRSYGYPYAFRLHTVSTRLCTQNTFAVCRSGVADRTMRPLTDQFAAAYLCLPVKEFAG